MKILNLDTNRAYDMADVPDEVEDLSYAVLDNSNPKDPDCLFVPLIFLESFNAPAMVLSIGNNIIKMPVDWQILIGEPDIGNLEVLPLTSLNDRGFSAYTFNPISSFRPEFHKVEILDIYQDVKWFSPKLKAGHLLAVPFTDNEKPLCAFFVKDLSKQHEIVDFSLIF